MDEVLRQDLLYDFYGELLTEHQRTVYEAVVHGDLSYSEAAEEFGVSRQGVHDLVKRCQKQLAGYESKLHLLERFLKVRTMVEEIRRLAGKTGEPEETLRGELMAKTDGQEETLRGEPIPRTGEHGETGMGEPMPKTFVEQIEALSEQILEEL